MSISINGSHLTGKTYTADEWGDQGDTGLGASNSLSETEEESEVAVNVVLSLKLAGSLDTLPCGRNLDKNAVLGDADRLVESDELLGLRLGGLLVEGQAGIDLSGDTAGDDLEDLLAELDEL